MTAEEWQQAQLDIARDAIREIRAERDQLRRWLRACSLGRDTKETHAEIRAYLAEVDR